MTFKDFIEGETAVLPPPVVPAKLTRKLLEPTPDIKKKHMKRILDIGTLRKGVFTPHQNLGVPRASMPQVKNREEFINWLVKERGVHVERITSTAKDLVQPSGNQTLAHAQQVMHLDKARSLIDRQKLINKKIILSKDNIIFDGNHHWFALMLKCPKCPVEMYRVNLPFQELLALSKEFPGVSYEENYSFGNFVDLREGFLGKPITAVMIWAAIQLIANQIGIPEGTPIEDQIRMMAEKVAAYLHTGVNAVLPFVQKYFGGQDKASLTFPGLTA